MPQEVYIYMHLYCFKLRHYLQQSHKMLKSTHEHPWILLNVKPFFLI
jgi:hypothetical protein